LSVNKGIHFETITQKREKEKKEEERKEWRIRSWGGVSCSSLTPPSLFSSLQPSLCSITSRGDWGERSEACSSHSVI